MEPILITKVTRYCLFKKRDESDPDCKHYLTRVWHENPYGLPATNHTWIMAHQTANGMVATTGPSFEDVNPELAEKLEKEYQAWLKKNIK